MPGSEGGRLEGYLEVGRSPCVEVRGGEAVGATVGRGPTVRMETSTPMLFTFDISVAILDH